MNIRKFAVLLAPLCALSGCSFGASIDTLMAPPKLSVEQEQIYNALTSTTGSAISLKYPKSGKYLSAFIIEDIDGDGSNEAVVFYERNVHSVDENPLRINILDKENGKWTSTYDQPAEGSEIEQVIISRRWPSVCAAPRIPRKRTARKANGWKATSANAASRKKRSMGSRIPRACWNSCYCWKKPGSRFTRRRFVRCANVRKKSSPRPGRTCG